MEGRPSFARLRRGTLSVAFAVTGRVAAAGVAPFDESRAGLDAAGYNGRPMNHQPKFRS
jgi:hypothetical protein